MKRAMTILTVCELLFLLTGCAAVSDFTERHTNTRPYLNVSQGYITDADWYREAERKWNCDDGMPTQIEVGTEVRPWYWGSTKMRAGVGYQHQSNMTCGEPFNDKPETWLDQVLIWVRAGGF